jgi:RimJ/RimL family protein N-acetyltransferase
VVTTAIVVSPDRVCAANIPAGTPAGRFGTAGDAIVLSDGTRVPVRPILPADAAALRRFHHRLSERTVYQRFFAPHPELSVEQARYFTGVDGRRRFALVAVDPDRPSEIVAVVRFDHDTAGDGAEYAAVVADDWQGRGLGRALTQRLIAAARSRGIRQLYAFVLPDNSRMRNLLLGLGMPARTGFSDGMDRIELDLAGTQAARGGLDSAGLGGDPEQGLSTSP